MFQEIKEVLRLLMLMTKHNKKHGLRNRGGLLVLIWTETDPNVQSLNCTVAAAGPWCAGLKMEQLHPVFTGVMNRLYACPGPCPEPDIEDLCAFTDLHGSLSVFLSFLPSSVECMVQSGPVDRYNSLCCGALQLFQGHLWSFCCLSDECTPFPMKDALQIFRPKWPHHIETFFHTFSLANAEIRIHLKLTIDQKSHQLEFRVKNSLRVALSTQQTLFLDVSLNTHQLESSMGGRRCYGGHPNVGERLLLTIPPKAMEQDLFGTVTLQPVTLLRPCVLQYPNVATNLTQIRVLVYSPSNVPVTRPSTFLQNLPANLNCQELGLQSDCLSFHELIPSGGTVYKIEQLNCQETSEEANLFSIDQSLVLFLFLQYSDPFTTEISDIMATEMLLEHHLEDIFNNNKQAVTNAMTNELKKSLIAQNSRKKDQEKMCSACEVIISSSISIISCSSNMEFRNACLSSMKVHSTHQLLVAFSESLRRVTLWKCVPKRMCCSDQIGQQPGSNKHIRVEM